jgi:hypothetical protein
MAASRSRVARLAAAALASAALLAGCPSPEASRARGGGPGADVRNVGDVVVLHGGSRPFYDTPCRERECKEPEPVHAAARR